MITRLARAYWRPAAVTACLLGLSWSIVQTGLIWANVDEPFWFYRRYFLDPYIAGLVLGLVVARWWIVSVAGVGVIADLIVTIGATETRGEEFSPSYEPAWAAYLDTALLWVWIAGLIAFGILLSRHLGGLRTPPLAQS